MKMRGCQIEGGHFGELLCFAHNNGSISRAHAGIDHQHRAGADYICDIRETNDRVDVFGDTHRGVFRHALGILGKTDRRDQRSEEEPHWCTSLPQYSNKGANQHE